MADTGIKEVVEEGKKEWQRREEKRREERKIVREDGPFYRFKTKTLMGSSFIFFHPLSGDSEQHLFYSVGPERR